MPIIHVRVKSNAALDDFLCKLETKFTMQDLADLSVGDFLGPPDRARGSVKVDSSIDRERALITVKTISAYRCLALSKMFHLRLATDTCIELKEMHLLESISKILNNCSMQIQHLCSMQMQHHHAMAEWAAASDVIEVFVMVLQSRSVSKTTLSATMKALIQTRIKRELLRPWQVIARVCALTAGTGFSSPVASRPFFVQKDSVHRSDVPSAERQKKDRRSVASSFGKQVEEC